MGTYSFSMEAGKPASVVLARDLPPDASPSFYVRASGGRIGNRVDGVLSLDAEGTLTLNLTKEQLRLFPTTYAVRSGGAVIVDGNALLTTSAPAAGGGAHGETHAPGGSDPLYPHFGHNIPGAVESIPRYTASGSLYFGAAAANLFVLATSVEDIEITQLSFMCHAVATTNAYGYLTLNDVDYPAGVDGSPWIVPVAATANDPTIATGANGLRTRLLSADHGFPTTYLWPRGKRMAIGLHVKPGETTFKASGLPLLHHMGRVLGSHIAASASGVDMSTGLRVEPYSASSATGSVLWAVAH